MNIIYVDPQSDQLWIKLITQQKSSAFHLPRWIQVLANTYGLDVRAYILVDAAGEPLAGLPFCRIEDIRGKRIVILPFSDYCDPLVGNIDQWNCLIDELLKEQCPVIIRCLHNQIPLADERFELFNQAKWHGLDLQPDLDSLWHGLHGSARRAIKKAQQEGIVVQIAQEKEQLRAFFEMHLEVRKYKYRLLAQPYHFFENIWDQFIKTQSGLLMVALYQGQIIGGTLFLKWQDKLFYKFNASARFHLDYRPNDLLIWEGIKYGKSHGCTSLDFGLSDADQEGLLRYKRKFATEEKTISFLHHKSNRVLTEQERQIQSLLPQLTKLLTDEAVSDIVTEKAGETLYRFFV